MGGSLVDRADALNYYKKCEHKCKKDLKALRKQKKMLFMISKKSISCLGPDLLDLLQFAA